MSDEEDYYNGRSKQESVVMAAWCFIAVLILAVLAALRLVFGGAWV